MILEKPLLAASDCRVLHYVIVPAEAFETLANSFEPEEIGGKAYNLYEKFRPVVPDGAKGWGARGLLDLKHVHELAA